MCTAVSAVQALGGALEGGDVPVLHVVVEDGEVGAQFGVVGRRIGGIQPDVFVGGICRGGKRWAPGR